jgi:hypothetical protein
MTGRRVAQPESNSASVTRSRVGRDAADTAPVHGAVPTLVRGTSHGIDWALGKLLMCTPETAFRAPDQSFYSDSWCCACGGIFLLETMRTQDSVGCSAVAEVIADAYSVFGSVGSIISRVTRVSGSGPMAVRCSHVWPRSVPQKIDAPLAM